MQSQIQCPDCKAFVPNIEGPVHAYIGGSAGCWQIYGEILAKEYSDPAYWKVHRLTVDAYMAQHPGKPSRQAIQSVNVHLLALYLIFEKHYSFDAACKALGDIIKKKKGRFTWLSQPEDLGTITVVDVTGAQDAHEHEQRVIAWAKSVWAAWLPHHSSIEALAKEL
ncbi:hypothetical protein E6Q11_03875 [Candidatus Dojkabacteria bacterium]|uniref:Uncharacterized protein n=1 Tax=Candidatus Dojkabacteria bacterium TaxID=2099670 RepID=A0A5C7J607_9BACT|nr:MAG: hypothetical protein E6Q11_03875 [Candidatus Dojkabacteria bacterium]